MKIYEIREEENDWPVGTLLYYEKSGDCIIELQEYLDEWTAPLLFTGLIKKNIYTIPRQISFLWVKERVIPSGRQNIGSILANHGLKEYDEMKLLELAEGRCSQDRLFIRRRESLPDYVVERQSRNLVDCLIRGREELICFFADNTARMIGLSKLTYLDDVDKLLDHEILFHSGKIGCGGYSVTFNDSIDIPASDLYRMGELLPVTLNDFMLFANNNLLDTSQSCEVMECSRQNLSYQVKQQKLTPVKTNVKGNLYLKGDVLRLTWS